MLDITYFCDDALTLSQNAVPEQQKFSKEVFSLEKVFPSKSFIQLQGQQNSPSSI